MVASDDRARWDCAGMVDLYGGQASAAVTDLDPATLRAWLRFSHASWNGCDQRADASGGASQSPRATFGVCAGWTRRGDGTADWGADYWPPAARRPVP